jgi:hypothetical protein
MSLGIPYIFAATTARLGFIVTQTRLSVYNREPSEQVVLQTKNAAPTTACPTRFVVRVPLVHAIFHSGYMLSLGLGFSEVNDGLVILICAIPLIVMS